MNCARITRRPPDHQAGAGRGPAQHALHRRASRPAALRRVPALRSRRHAAAAAWPTADRLVIVPALGREIRIGRDLQALVQLRAPFQAHPAADRPHPLVQGRHPGPPGRPPGRDPGRRPLGARLLFLPVPVLLPAQFLPARRKVLPPPDQPLHLRRPRRHRPGPQAQAGRRDNFSLIRSGFPLEKFLGRRDDPAALKARFDLPAGDFVCGAIAPFKPQKGLLHLAAIAAIGHPPGTRRSSFSSPATASSGRNWRPSCDAARHRGEFPPARVHPGRGERHGLLRYRRFHRPLGGAAPEPGAAAPEKKGAWWPATSRATAK